MLLIEKQVKKCGRQLLATDVYFVGGLNGRLFAFNAASGDSLWASPKTGPVIGWVWADETNVYFPTGSPKLFGSYAKGGANGLFSFGITPEQAEARK